MAQYRKKPVVIEAFEWQPHATVGTAPEWFYTGCRARKLFPEIDGTLSIFTLEGKMTGNVGDYIIRGIQGEMYPCKPDIFAATYELFDCP